MSSRCEGHQPLNPIDIALCEVDRTIRGMGYPGFETQMLVWLSGRIDATTLRRAIVQLGQCHPVISSRLVENGSGAGRRPCWQFQRGTDAALQEIELDSSEESAVLAWAARLQSSPHEPAVYPPLRFYLLHRPDGRDVFLMQYNHVLMNNSATVLLVREIDQLFRQGETADEPTRAAPRNLVHQHLRRVSHADRRVAAQGAIELQGRALRGRAALLSTGEEDKPRRVSLQVATRTLEPNEARAIHVRTVKVCGLPSLSMAILACTFRAIRRLGSAQRNAGRNYIAGIGLDLGLERDQSALLQNLLSIVPISAASAELDDREQLVRSLTRQLRQRLAEKIDLGVLRLMNGFQRRPRHIRWVVEHMLRWGYSLWYAYFGSLDSVGPRFCDVEIEKVFYVGPVWSPIGVALLVNQYQGRLYFQATYDPELVTTRLAEAFFEDILAELSGFAAS